MKKVILYTICLTASLLGFNAVSAQNSNNEQVASAAQLKLSEVKQSMEFSLKNPNKTNLKDAPICIALPTNCLYQSATVIVGGKEIPCQMDDLDGDGFKEELAFVLDMKKNGKSTVKVEFGLNPAAEDRYPSRVYAMMFFRDKKHGNHIPTDTVSEVVDDMYSKIFPHGPAFESELIAMRVYFNSKQSADLYGKKVKQLELKEGMWYSCQNEELKKRQFGDDIILVGQTVSVGGIRGWDETNKENPLLIIDPFEWRQAHVIAKGPVRTIVDMNVRGWKYKGKSLNLKSRYTLYAGQRECEIIQQFDDAAQGLEFMTGALKVGTITNDPEEIANARASYDEKGTCASFGKDWADNNHKLFPDKQEVGVAVSVPQKYVTRFIDRPDQMLYGIRPDENNAILYKIAFCAATKETFEQWTADSWFKYVNQWKNIKPVVVSLK